MEQAIENADDAIISDVFRRDVPAADAFPALALPLVSKGSLECPPSHLEVLAESFRDVDRVLIIGWRGAEKHFLELWREQGGELKRLAIVAESITAAEATAANLDRERIRLVGVRTIGSGFSGLLDNPEFAEFLEE